MMVPYVRKVVRGVKKLYAEYFLYNLFHCTSSFKLPLMKLFIVSDTEIMLSVE